MRHTLLHRPPSEAAASSGVAVHLCGPAPPLVSSRWERHRTIAAMGGAKLEALKEAQDTKLIPFSTRDLGPAR